MHFTKREFETLFVGDAIIRGPLIWDAQKFSELGTFNDVAFFLGRDDCDICLRASHKKWIVGYLPCFYVSRSLNGTSRKPRSADTVKAMNARSDLSLLFPGELHKFWNTDDPTECFVTKKDLDKIRITE
jgi:hypothetical protein